MSRLTVAEISTVVSLRWGDGNQNNFFQATWQQPSKIILILSVLHVNNLKIFSSRHTLCNVFALFDCHGPVVHFLATDTFNISPTIPSAGFGSNVTNALFLKNWMLTWWPSSPCECTIKSALGADLCIEISHFIVHPNTYNRCQYNL